MEYDERTGAMFSVKPLPLFIIRSKEEKAPVDEAEGDAADGSKPAEGESEKKEGEPEKKEEGKADASMKSGLSMSIADTTEDGDAKAAEEAARAKKAAKGLTQKELDASVDIELTETQT
jgi:hypothetical protein